MPAQERIRAGSAGGLDSISPTGCTGDVRQYDVSDPANPRLTGYLWLGAVLGRPATRGASSAARELQHVRAEVACDHYETVRSS